METLSTLLAFERGIHRSHNHSGLIPSQFMYDLAHATGTTSYTCNMMTSSNGNIFRVTGHLCGEFTGDRWIPRTKTSDASFDVFFDRRLNKQLNKQSWGWWFETPSHPLWRHRNELYKRFQGRYLSNTNQTPHGLIDNGTKCLHSSW